MPLVDRLSPSLTTVRIEQYEVRFDAASIRVEMIGMPAERASHATSPHPVELIVRTSTEFPPGVT
jgi:DNA-binding LacI/PurR family transcriptional regulator